MALTIAERIALQKAKKATSIAPSNSNNTILPFKIKEGENAFRIIALKESDFEYNKEVLKSESDTYMKLREWASGEFTAYNKPTKFRGLPYMGKKYPQSPVGDKFQEAKGQYYGESLKVGKEFSAKAVQYNQAKADGDLTSKELLELKQQLDELKDIEMDLKASSDRFYCDNNPRVYFLVIDRSTEEIKYYPLSVKQYDMLEKAIEDGMLNNAKSAVVESFMQLDNIKKLDKTSASKVQKQLKIDLNNTIKSLEDLVTIEEGLQPLVEKYDLTQEEVNEVLDYASSCLDAHSEENGYDVIATGRPDVYNGKPCVKLASFDLDEIQTPAFKSEKDKKSSYESAPTIMGDIFKILTPEFIDETLDKMFDDASTETKSTPKKPTVESKTIPTKKPLTREPEPEDEDEVDDSELDFEEDEYTEDED